jgi:hypothetical protein
MVSSHLGRSYLFNQQSCCATDRPVLPRRPSLSVHAPKNKSPKPPSKTAQNHRVKPPTTPKTHKHPINTGDFSPPTLAYLPPPTRYNRTSPPMKAVQINRTGYKSRAARYFGP